MIKGTIFGQIERSNMEVDWSPGGQKSRRLLYKKEINRSQSRSLSLSLSLSPSLSLSLSFFTLISYFASDTFLYQIGDSNNS